MADHIEPYEVNILGFDVVVNASLGLLSVEHDGSITWDQLQAVKSTIWGSEVAAIEVYPPESMAIKNATMRHLWCMGVGDWWPDLLGRLPNPEFSNLRRRFDAAWAAAN